MCIAPLGDHLLEEHVVHHAHNLDVPRHYYYYYYYYYYYCCCCCCC